MTGKFSRVSDLCEGNPLVTELSLQKAVNGELCFFFFILSMNRQLHKQWICGDLRRLKSHVTLL